MTVKTKNGSARVVIVGGGVAGIETLLALADLGGDRVSQTLVSPRPDFLYKPLLVEEPFDIGPAERYELQPLAEEKGASFTQRAVSGVRKADHQVELDDGSTLEYDFLVVCAGGRFVPALDGAITFPYPGEAFRVDSLLDRAVEQNHRIVFIVPGGVTWSLPLYEIALMTQRRAVQRDPDLKIAVITPESAPLAVFGPTASAAIAELLRGRRIEVIASSTAREIGEDGIRLSPGSRVLGPAVAVALPVMEGPSIEGLPADDRGFIPIDELARVKGAEDVYAAGDGTTFPIKQGGIATQEADTAAEDIAHRVGAGPPARPFRPILRGKLLTGDESVNLRAEVAGGAGEGEASLDTLWWPPQKISARYLAPLLYHGYVREDLEPPRHSLDVEVALPMECHEEPMAIDPLEPPRSTEAAWRFPPPTATWLLPTTGVTARLWSILLASPANSNQLDSSPANTRPRTRSSERSTVTSYSGSRASRSPTSAACTGRGSSRVGLAAVCAPPLTARARACPWPPSSRASRARGARR